MRQKLESISEDAEENEQLCEILVPDNNPPKICKLNCDKETETSPLNKNLSILNDFVRYDVGRWGRCSCTCNYKISVQYDDDFMKGKTRSNKSCLFSPGTKYIEFYSGNSNSSHPELFSNFKSGERKLDPLFLLEYDDDYAVWWTRKKTRTFTVLDSERNSLASFKSLENELQINLRNVNLKGRSGRENVIVIENNENAKLATIETFPTARNGPSYGVCVIDDEMGPEMRAVLIGVAVGVDVTTRESEAKFTFFWIPICFLGVILFFTAVQWWGKGWGWEWWSEGD